MKVSIDLNNLREDETIKKLENKFKCAGKELEKKILPAIRASIEECCMMLSGKPIPDNSRDIKVDKAFYIIRNSEDDVILNEDDLSGLFCITNSESEEILREVKVKYGAEIRSKLDKSIESIIKKAKKKGDYYYIVIKSINIFEEMNIILNRIAPEIEQILKVESTGSLYKISEDSLEKLVQYYSNCQANSMKHRRRVN
ncbi:MAG: hypothetical protein MJA82_16700 [Clostridia bacterium]|nr:hypothetical protein [Clostridia bacterium]